MLHSLRFRLPALFLAGIVLSALVSTVIAVRLVQDYNRDRAYTELRREAIGLATIYAKRGKELEDLEGPGGGPFWPPEFEEATGDEIFFAGAGLFPGANPGVRELPVRVVDYRDGRVKRVRFEHPDTGETYIGVAAPVNLGRQLFGALVAATPEAELGSRWLPLIERLAIAFAGGVLIAGALGWYLTRRITKPVLTLSEAADQVAAGRYDVDVPRMRGGDEVSLLADRFRVMTTRLREADELARNFLMTVSHDLRTPLTAIRGHLEALREGLVEDPEAQRASLEIMLREAERLDRLVGDILDLAKLEARRFTVRREEVDMGRLVDTAYGAFSEEARKRRIEYSADADGRPVIVSDGDRVLQIITNLLSNAFRWTPDGGEIDMELAADNGTVCVAVSDTGPGIPPEERDRIFRPFWSRDGRGTGLGLAIANELAGALGGRIELESEPGKGSRFQLVLPAELSADAREAD